jgi:hypothetical protein
MKNGAQRDVRTPSTRNVSPLKITKALQGNKRSSISNFIKNGHETSDVTAENHLYPSENRNITQSISSNVLLAGQIFVKRVHTEFTATV